MSQQQPKHEKQVEYYVRHAEEKKIPELRILTIRI